MTLSNSSDSSSSMVTTACATGKGRRRACAPASINPEVVADNEQASEPGALDHAHFSNAIRVYVRARACAYARVSAH